MTHEMPVQRYVSGQCNVWSAETYLEEDNGPSEASVCQPCRDISGLSFHENMVDASDGSQIKEEEHPGDVNDWPASDFHSDNSGFNDDEEYFSELKLDESQIFDNIEESHDVKHTKSGKDMASLQTFAISRKGSNTNNGVHTCPECGKTFGRKNTLKTHLESVHQGKKFPCQFCDRIYADRGGMIKHMKNAHNRRPDSNERNTVEKIAIEALEALTADYTGYTTPIAVIRDKVTSYLKILPAENVEPEDEYRDDHHPFHEAKDWMSILFPDTEDPVCPLCSSKFRTSAFMILHLKLKHAFDWFQCPQCNIWRNLPGEIISHCIDKHNDMDLEVVCPCCKMSFSTATLEEHSQLCFSTKCDRRATLVGYSVPGNRSVVKCRLCSDIFPSRLKYQDHLRSSHDEKIFKCDHSGCDFITVNDRKEVQRHMSTVHKENPGSTADKTQGIVCDICGRKFGAPGVLLNHKINEHNTTSLGQALFPCHECDEAFGNKHSRNMHINSVHLKISFACQKCGKSFKQKVKLCQHMRKVHEKDRIRMQCQICQEWVCNKETLQNHTRRKHTGERPYTCTFCGKACFSATSMTSHRREKHPDSWAAEKRRRVWQRNNKGKDSTEYKMQCHLCEETRQNIDELRAHWDEEHPGETDLGNNALIGQDHEEDTRGKHTGERTFACSFCDKQFCGQFPNQQMYAHKRAKHPDSWAAEKRRRDWLRDNKGKDPTEYKMQCHLCKQTRKNIEQLRAHWDEEHSGETDSGNNTLITLYLNREKQPDSWAAEKRKRDWLRNNKEKDPTEYKMQCHLCEQTRKNIKELRAHWDEGHPGETDLASKKYLWSTDVRDNEETGFTCEFCGKHYQFHVGLRQHINATHSEPRRKECKCDICGKDISTKSNLVLHKMRVHKMEHETRVDPHTDPTKKVLCDICGSSFVKGQLRLHMRSHDNEVSRPRNCTYCNKEFPNFLRMTRHRRIAHSEQWAVDKDTLMKKEGSIYLGKEHPGKKYYERKKKERMLEKLAAS